MFASRPRLHRDRRRTRPWSAKAGAAPLREGDDPASAFRPAIVVAAYECEATIGAVVTGARTHALPVLVVDDGSRDRTAAVARAVGADVVRHPRNRGKGAALVTGMRILARRGHSHAVTMDGDGQHLASEIPRLLERAIATPGAIVIGVRRIGDQAVAGIKLFGNRCADLAVSAAAGVPVPDTQSGFRAYPLAAVLRLPAHGRRFEYESTVIIVAARAGIPIRSVPVGVYYPPVAERRSHYRMVADTVRIIRAVAPLWMRRTAAPLDVPTREPASYADSRPGSRCLPIAPPEIEGEGC